MLEEKKSHLSDPGLLKESKQFTKETLEKGHVL